MIERMRLPYVGIGGVNGTHQQRTLELLYDTLHLENKRRLLLGARANYTTQILDKADPHGSSWYPVGDAFGGALQWSGESVGVAQVTTGDDPEVARMVVDRVIERGRRWIHAVMLDEMPYRVAPESWRPLIDHIHEHKLDVFVGGQGDAEPEQAIAALLELGPVEQVVFDTPLDTNGGRQTDLLNPYLEQAFSDRTLARRHTGTGISKMPSRQMSTPVLAELIRSFPELSWMAEEIFHPPIHPETGAAQEYGRLNTGTAWQYLRVSDDAFRQ